MYAPLRAPSGALHTYTVEGPHMAWVTLRHTLSDVNAAGETLILPDIPEPKMDEAMSVINNWRAAHSFPLNTFKVTLRENARQVDPNATTAQRLKRLSSIDKKLREFKRLPRLRDLGLSDIQDIAGCRAIVQSVKAVDNLVALYKESDLRHEIDDEDDYIRSPKKSGYRGVHVIYRYHSDKKQAYNGRKIEMQFRSVPQHIWATAVETVSAFTDQALKSSRGENDWLRFFKLMGTEIAIRERTEPVPDTPTSRTDLKAELKELVSRLGVENRLQTYGAAASTMARRPKARDSYFLMVLNAETRTVKVTPYLQSELKKASRDYIKTEKDIKGRADIDAVLVSVESLNSLRRAYPNYFLDTNRFLSVVRRAVS